MASSNIKLFDENKGNMLSDSEFSISNQRMNGLQTGVASSQLQNKAMYQASLIAYAIAQVMMQNGKNANDTDAVSAFVANLSGTMLQKVYDIATTAEAQAGVATGKWMSPALVKAAIDTLAAKAQNILSNETKAMYGLGTNAVPDGVFVKISELLNGKVSLVTSSYVGTGTYGQSNPNVLTFDFLPRFLIVIDPAYANGMLAVYGNTGRPLTIGSSGNRIGEYVDEVTFNDSNKQVSWYTRYNRDGGADYQGNAQGRTYCYICFGIGG